MSTALRPFSWLFAAIPVVLFVSTVSAQEPTLTQPAAAVSAAPIAEAVPSPLKGLDAAQADAYLIKLIEAVRNDASFKVRLQAAVFLGRSNDDRAFEPLAAALTADESYLVRASAATALANLNDPRGISYLIKRVATDSDPFVREEAGRALAKFDREQAVPYVVATYGSDNAEVRRQALLCLADLDDEAARQVVIRALGDVEEIFVVAKKAAQEMPANETLLLLEEALDHRDAGVRRGAVRVLRALNTNEAAQLSLKVYERDIEADGVRNETRKALRDMRSFLDINTIVKDAVYSSPKHTRAKALKLLGVLGGTEAEKVLVEALADPDVYLRGTAVMAMGELGNPSVVPALEKLEGDPANQRILHLVRHTLKQLRKKQGE